MNYLQRAFPRQQQRAWGWGHGGAGRFGGMSPTTGCGSCEAAAADEAVACARSILCLPHLLQAFVKERARLCCCGRRRRTGTTPERVAMGTLAN